MIKAMTLLTLQLMAQGFSTDRMEYETLVAKNFAEFYMENVEYMIVYFLIVFSVGVALGFYAKKIYAVLRMVEMLDWTGKKLKIFVPKRCGKICYVDGENGMNCGNSGFSQTLMMPGLVRNISERLMMAVLPDSTGRTKEPDADIK